MPLLVLAITRSVTLTGLTGSLTFAVMWILQLPAGFAADRYDRRKIMLTCDGIRGLAQITLVAAILTRAVSIPLILGLVVVTTAAWTFFGPAQMRAIRTIVLRDQIIEATAASTARSYAADLAGPFLGGLLFTARHLIPFLVDSASFAISAASITQIRSHLGNNPDAPPPAAILTQIRRGWTYTWKNPLLRGSMLYSAGSNFVATGLIFAIILLTGSNKNGGTPVGAALSIAAAGGILGAAIAPAMMRKFTIRQILIATGATRTVLIACFAITAQPLILGGLLASFIMLAPTASTTLSALRSQIVPAEILGKTTASTSFVATGLQPIAPVATGLLLTHFGRTATALSLGCLMLLVLVYVHKAAGFKETPKLMPAPVIDT